MRNIGALTSLLLFTLSSSPVRAQAAASPHSEASSVPAKSRLQITGLHTPESVLYDDQADTYLVSNVNGSPFAKDDNGFISRVAPSGEVTTLKWIDGAQANVVLNAPKGL